MIPQEVKQEPYSNPWKVYRKVGDGFYILYRSQRGGVTYAPLYIHSFRFLKNRHLTKSQIFLYENPNSEKLVTVSDKLKWYRANSGLLQRDVAIAMGVDRTTYARYEENVLDAYPLDKLSKAAALFGIDITALLDDYNLFLYHGQGEQIKKLRKSLKLTQSEFAKYIGASLSTLKSWEQNKARIQKRWYKTIKHRASQY